MINTKKPAKGKTPYRKAVPRVDYQAIFKSKFEFEKKDPGINEQGRIICVSRVFTRHEKMISIRY